MNSEIDERRFWETIALQMPSQRVNDTEIPEDLELLLWALAEGRLAEVDEPRLWQLAADHPAAAARLSQIQASILVTDGREAGLEADAAWARVSRRWAESKKAQTTLWNLIVEITERGLQLIESNGQAAYAPALARSAENLPPTSIAQQFLTSIGTVRVTIDWQSPSNLDDPVCDVTVEPLILSPRVAKSSSAVELHTHEGEVIHRAADFQETAARFDAVPSGQFAFVFIVDGEEIARLSVDLRAALSNQ